MHAERECRHIYAHTDGRNRSVVRAVGRCSSRLLMRGVGRAVQRSSRAPGHNFRWLVHRSHATAKLPTFKLQHATSRPSSEHHHHSQQTPLNHASHLSPNAGRRQERWNVLILRAGLATISTGLERSQRGRRDEQHLGKSGQRLRDIFGCMEALVGVIFSASASSWHLFFGRFAGAMWRLG
jgi:hypothetical protein